MPLPSQVHVPSTEEKDYMIEQQDGKWCLVSKSTGKTLGCHDTKEGAEAQERAVQANKSEQTKTVVISTEKMAEICPPCSEKMKAKSIKHLKLDLSSDLKFQLSSETLAGLCDKFGAAEGFRTKCVDSGLSGGVDDIGAFCNWLKQQCHGSSTSKENDSVHFDINETHNIKDVEIFSAGDWNGDTYTKEDLEDIETAFKETKPYLKPYLKLGHGDNQSLLRSDELPAAGYVSDVYVRGDKLYADFERMPRRIFDLVRAGAYDKLSCEIFLNVKVNGKIYEKALKAIALLGGDTPAVENLEQIRALYKLEEAVLAYAKDTDIRAYQYQSPKTRGTKTMAEHLGCPEELEAARKELKEMKGKYASIDADIKKYSDENSALKSRTAELEKENAENKKKYADASVEIEKVQSEKRLAHVESKVKELVNDKKVLPAQADSLKALLLNSMSGIQKFKLGDKEVGQDEVILEFIEKGSGKSLPTKESSESGKSSKVDQPERHTEAFASNVQKYAVENKLTYKEAYTRLCAEPEGAGK